MRRTADGAAPNEGSEGGMIRVSSTTSIAAAAGHGSAKEVPSLTFLSSRQELGVAAAFLCTTTAVALTVSDLGMVLEFVGGTSGVLISFVVPSGCFLFLSTRWGLARAAALGTFVLGLTLLPLDFAFEFMPAE
eukprot:4614784-Prymnesium_polylepis.1